jgi:hypothetical protein
MSAIPRHLMRAVALAFTIGSIAFTAQADEPSTGADRVSTRMSDAILAEFRKVEISTPPTSEEIPNDSDPEVVVLRELVVRERFDVDSLNSDPRLQSPVPRPLFSTLGTGITEYRGNKVSVLTQRVLFIPLGFKLAW